MYKVVHAGTDTVRAVMQCHGAWGLDIRVRVGPPIRDIIGLLIGVRGRYSLRLTGSEGQGQGQGEGRGENEGQDQGRGQDQRQGEGQRQD